MIDRDIKRSLGQMAKGVQVVAATHDGVTRAYTSHWVGRFDDYLTETDGVPHVVDCIAWLKCEIDQKIDLDIDHDLFVARVTATGEGRLAADPLVYSSRHGWRIAADKARLPGESVRDRLLARLARESGEADTTDT